MCLSKGSSLYSLSSRIKLSNTAYSNYRLEVVARVLVLTLKNFSGSIGNLRMKLKTFYLKTGKSEQKIWLWITHSFLFTVKIRFKDFRSKCPILHNINTAIPRNTSSSLFLHPQTARSSTFAASRWILIQRSNPAWFHTSQFRLFHIWWRGRLHQKSSIDCGRTWLETAASVHVQSGNWRLEAY